MKLPSKPQPVRAYHLMSADHAILFVTKFTHWSYEEEVRAIVELKHAVKEGTRYFWPWSKHLQLKEVISAAKPQSFCSAEPGPKASYRIVTRAGCCALAWRGIIMRRQAITVRELMHFFPGIDVLDSGTAVSPWSDFKGEKT